MKVRASVKKMCRKCKVVRRKGVVRIIRPPAQATPRVILATLSLANCKKLRSKTEKYSECIDLFLLRNYNCAFTATSGF